MRSSTITRMVVAAGVVAMLGPAVSWADKTVEAGPPSRFTTTVVTMDQGERLTFHNGDTVSHDVTASAPGPDGKPLFESSTVASGKSAFVEGSQFLTEGHYDFFCSIHPNMKGSIHVTANGTPQQRPGAPSQSPAADKTKPKLRLRLLSRTTRTARARQALVVRVSVSELSHVELRAVARPKPGGPLVTVARRVLHSATGSKRVNLKLTRAGRAALRRHGSLAVVVNGFAVDRSGNLTRAVHGRTLAP
jgi:plastocyanin